MTCEVCGREAMARRERGAIVVWVHGPGETCSLRGDRDGPAAPAPRPVRLVEVVARL